MNTSKLRQTPRFSVIIPCYNQGPFLKECLNSVLGQTLPAYEILVVDDGSTDPDTILRLDTLCKPPVTLIRKNNGGLSSARNAGVAAARGDFLLPLDGDDQLTPDALASYAAAIGEHPDVDIFYPDVEHFGLEKLLWVSPLYNPYVQLFDNQLVCSSAISARVFRSGLRYNEEMRLGYEDWEFYLRAYFEYGFPIKHLGKAVFRYRRWGYSMLSASNARRQELLSQLQKLPIYRDQNRIAELKRTYSPCFVISTGHPSLETTLASQSFPDYRVVDTQGSPQKNGDLRVFLNPESPRWGRYLLVSLADGELDRTLQQTPFLLETISAAFVTHNLSALWLVAPKDPGRAYPGVLLMDAASDEGMVPVGVVLAMTHLCTHPVLPKTSAGLVADLQTYLRQTATITTKRMLTCAFLDSKRPSESGPIHNPIEKTERSFFLRETDLDAREERRRTFSAYQVAIREPVQPPLSIQQKGQGLLIVLPWIVRGGADRATIEMLRHLSSLRPNLRCYVATTLEAELCWAQDVMPYVDGFFSLPTRTSNPSEELCRLVDRLGIGTMLINNSQAAMDALPLLRQSGRRLRVVVQCHGFDRDLQTGELAGHPAHAASRYNNLIDAYAVISKRLRALLCDQFYVSPSKIHVVKIGILREWYALSQRPRFVDKGPWQVLWLGRIAREKDPMMLLKVAKCFRERHGSSVLHFLLAGGEVQRARTPTPLKSELVEYFLLHRLSDVVTFCGEVSDPLPLYRRADCLMLTSLYEGMPLVIYEAMAAGMPVVTPVADTGIPEVLPPELGYYVEPRDDPNAYVAQLERILGDPAEARRRASCLEEKSAVYTSERYTSELLQVLG